MVCYSLSNEPTGRLYEVMTVLPLFINIGLGLNAINGYHSAMALSHDPVTIHILVDNTIDNTLLCVKGFYNTLSLEYIRYGPVL